MSLPKFFDARKYMRQAIDVMRSSIAEPRSDGKASPKVGAVLIKPDGSTQTAFRGELRYGDHAEFTLLERKNRGDDLTGSILFATLEPCAPNARSAPKLGCAERIVLARISEVWVGITDPDPTVDRKGIKHLQDHGIEVHMFDRDLQEIIQVENAKFIEQASERAAMTETAFKKVQLSKLEEISPQTSLTDFSTIALEAYRSGARIADAIDSDRFRRRLVQQGLLEERNERLIPTRNGLLLLGSNPRDQMPQAGLLATVYRPDAREEVQNFEDPLVLIPQQVLDWVRTKLPNPIDRSTAQHQEINTPLFTLIREAVVNGLVHRDYAIEGAKCQLEITPNTIIIKSPGQPIDPITLEQMQSFNAPMLSRNPVLHYVFAQMKLAEERGLGLKSMPIRAKEANLPLPKYTWDNPYLTLTIYTTPEASVATLSKAIRNNLTASELTGWQWLTQQGRRIKSSEYAKAVGLDTRTARRHLQHFIELGLVNQAGTTRDASYEVK